MRSRPSTQEALPRTWRHLEGKHTAQMYASVPVCMHGRHWCEAREISLHMPTSTCVCACMPVRKPTQTCLCVNVRICVHRYGHYTDDTQMALALTESLITQRTLDPAHVSRQYATRFEQHRGYGGTAQKVRAPALSHTHTRTCTHARKACLDAFVCVCMCARARVCLCVFVCVWP